MGGFVIEKVRDGVEFVPDAAAAFRRANAQVREELGRDIDVNSTYRSWSDQMKMFTDWNRYVDGVGPRPVHSKAVHPSDSFHVSGLALDSDDWVNARIVEILAENGFIRNRLHVAGENHHFEYIRSRDKNYGKEVDDVSAADVWNTTVHRPGVGEIRAIQELADAKTAAEKTVAVLSPIKRDGKIIPMRQDLADTGTIARRIEAQVTALTAAVQSLATANGADPKAIEAIVENAVRAAMAKLTVTLDIDG